MAAGRIILEAYSPARDRNGYLVPGARLRVLVNRTVNTNAPIFADSGLTTPTANPVIANASGRFPDIWADRGTPFVPILYTLAISGPDGENIGNPSVFDDWQPSVEEAASESAASAASSASEAAAQTEAAIDARVEAEAARDEASSYLSAFPADVFYTDEPTGRAAVADGEVFWVLTEDGSQSYTRIDAETPSTAGPLIPSKDQVEAAVAAAPKPRIIMTRQTNASANYIQVTPLSPIPADYQETIRFRLAAPFAKPPEQGVIIELAGFGEAFQLRVHPGGSGDQVPDGMWAAGEEIEWAFVPEMNYWLLTDVIRPPAVPVPEPEPEPEQVSDAAFWAAANSRIYTQRSFGK